MCLTELPEFSFNNKLLTLPRGNYLIRIEKEKARKRFSTLVFVVYRMTESIQSIVNQFKQTSFPGISTPRRGHLTEN